MSVAPGLDRMRPSEVVAGFLATAAIFTALVGIVHRPVRLAVAAIVLAIVAAAMGGRHRGLAAGAVAITTLSWLVGMVVAILTERPLF